MNGLTTGCLNRRYLFLYESFTKVHNNLRVSPGRRVGVVHSKLLIDKMYLFRPIPVLQNYRVDSGQNKIDSFSQIKTNKRILEFL